MTAGSIESSLLKQFPEVLATHQRELFASLQAPVALLGGFFQGGHLFGCSAVFPLRVIGGFDIDLSKRDNVRAADDADIFPPRRGLKPTAQILLGIGDR
jgi:hypothetical protein